MWDGQHRDGTARCVWPLCRDPATATCDRPDFKYHGGKVGWLIETNHIDGTPWWWNGKLYEDDDWTKDSFEALAFASKEDAEKIIRQIGWTTVTATEHRWG